MADDGRAHYHVIRDGLPVLVLFDESAAVGDPARPMCVTLGFDFEDEGTRGLPGAEEAAFVEGFERSLLEQAPVDLGLIWAGRRSGHGRVDWCLHAAAIPDLLDRVEALLARWPERLFEVRVLPDPDWEVFTNAFLPGPEERLSLENLNRIERLAEAGQDITAETAVEHRVVFEDADACARFREAIEAEGQTSRLHVAGEIRTVGITARHDLLLGTLELFSRRLARRAEEAGGRYMDWHLLDHG